MNGHNIEGGVCTLHKQVNIFLCFKASLNHMANSYRGVSEKWQTAKSR